MEKLYRVQMNKNGAPNFSTAEEVEPKQGEWLSTGADIDGAYYYQCSECGAEVCTDMRGVTYPHCPYCLARMKGADDER